jgi:hypothetical protein
MRRRPFFGICSAVLWFRAAWFQYYRRWMRLWLYGKYLEESGDIDKVAQAFRLPQRPKVLTTTLGTEITTRLNAQAAMCAGAASLFNGIAVGDDLKRG